MFPIAIIVGSILPFPPPKSLFSSTLPSHTPSNAEQFYPTPFSKVNVYTPSGSHHPVPKVLLSHLEQQPFCFLYWPLQPRRVGSIQDSTLSSNSLFPLYGILLWFCIFSHCQLNQLSKSSHSPSGQSMWHSDTQCVSDVTSWVLALDNFPKDHTFKSIQSCAFYPLLPHSPTLGVVQLESTDAILLSLRGSSTWGQRDSTMGTMGRVFACSHPGFDPRHPIGSPKYY